MRISLISVGARRGRAKREAEDVLADEYLQRAGRYAEVQGVWVETEAAFWKTAGEAAGRVPATVVLMDGGGKALSSVELAGVLGELRDRGAQRVVFGIGGADGWAAESKAKADLLVSLGRMTLPHGLARVVTAEQIYRAMTILAGHPYHCGH